MSDLVSPGVPLDVVLKVIHNFSKPEEVCSVSYLLGIVILSLRIEREDYKTKSQFWLILRDLHDN